ncbi:hypothetical protein P152DRAFT_441374 [Eremomyces bilateralis CBS 781.70]|uniref:Protein kinase domain-containing protein n=1 Tax=Eremomyces bilateralis CBS 781.70 TaxID=1392243 RepID=A0A6G1FV47_9PEZI|nr:uncharacterized protein P152DRAFT_441374 [Eremomyces bilateralis CBS 781.70]KAF1809578.1 hypothetical protein P152DRAFT_441374 [Eremomyces bilateralis CBS 781.70]
MLALGVPTPKAFNTEPIISIITKSKHVHYVNMGLEILEDSEAWEQMDDLLTFSHTKVILRDGSQYFFAITDRRYSPSSKIDPSTLKLHPIPISRIWPVFPANYTRAANPLPPNSYVKRPRLLYYGDSEASTDISLLLHEAQIYEVLAKSPHPNIVRYLGPAGDTKSETHKLPMFARPLAKYSVDINNQ